jgi:hypothetical protein
MKRCFNCKETKDLTEFYKNRTTKDGSSGICKSCQTHNEKLSNSLAKEWLNQIKTKCEICGESRSWVLDFHHLDPSKKTITISQYVSSGTVGLETKKKKVLKELENCILVCANCHRDIHYQEQTGAYQINKRNKVS